MVCLGTQDYGLTASTPLWYPTKLTPCTTRLPSSRVLLVAVASLRLVKALLTLGGLGLAWTYKG